MKESFDVIIVGGGTGGLVLAEALSRKGCRTAVLERQPRFNPLPRGELIQPNGLRILDHLGLLEEVKSAGAQLNYLFHFHRIGGPRLCTVDYRMLPPPYAYSLILLPEMLISPLLRRLSESKDARIYWGAEFLGLVRDGARIQGVRARYQTVSPATSSRRDSDEEQMLLSAPLVIGADGVYSQVREQLGIRYRLKRYQHGYLTMLIRRPEDFGMEVRYYVGRREILGLFPVSKDRLYLFYLVEGYSQAGPLHGGQFEDLNRLKKAVIAIDPMVEEPLSEITAWQQVAYMPCARVRADSWVAEGAALMGDAAHAMNPHASQGRNQALEDAMVLSEVILECFRLGDFSKDALGAYERRRREQVERLQRLGDEQVLFWNAGDPVRIWLRDRVFSNLERNSRLRYKMLAQVAGLDAPPFGLLDRLMATGLIPDARAHEIPRHTRPPWASG